MMVSLVSRRTLLRLALSGCVAAPAIRAQETTEGPITPMPDRAKPTPASGATPRETSAPGISSSGITPSGITQQSSESTFSSNVRVVNVFATVRSQTGEIVRDLNKDDFILSEDGRPQKVGYFSRESNLPLTIGFLLDTSGSMRGVLPEERSAARHFVEQVMREKQDQGFVIHFDREVELLHNVTNSREKLKQSLDEVEPSDRGGDLQSSGSGGPSGGGGWPGRGGGRGRGGGQHRGGGTLLFDAVMLASTEVMRKQSGRRALIVLSDGGDRGSKTTMISAIASAQRADTLIYSVFYKGEMPGSFGGRGARGGYGGGRNSDEIDVGKNVMRRMAHETGGSFFIVTEDRPIENAFGQIEEELRNQYSLGYTSDSTSTSQDFRRITLETRRPGLVVHARSGYYPGAG